MHRLCTDVSALVVTLSVAMEDVTIGGPGWRAQGTSLYHFCSLLWIYNHFQLKSKKMMGVSWTLARLWTVKAHRGWGRSSFCFEGLPQATSCRCVSDTVPLSQRTPLIHASCPSQHSGSWQGPAGTPPFSVQTFANPSLGSVYAALCYSCGTSIQRLSGSAAPEHKPLLRGDEEYSWVCRREAVTWGVWFLPTDSELISL